MKLHLTVVLITLGNKITVHEMKIIYLLILLAPLKNLAQTVNPVVPELPIPATLDQWKKQRKEIRQTLVGLMGDLPARPKATQVKTL